MAPPGAVRAGPGVRDEAVVADRLQVEVVEEAAQRAARRRGRPPATPACVTAARSRVGRGAAGVGGVLAVAGELDLLEAGRRQELEQLPPAAGQRHQRPEVGRVVREVRAAEVAHRRRRRRAAALAAMPTRLGHVALGERDRAHLAGRDEPAAGREHGRAERGSGHRAAAAAAATPAPAISERRLSFLCRTIMCLSVSCGVAAAVRGAVSGAPRRAVYGALTPCPPNSTQLRLKKLFAGPPGDRPEHQVDPVRTARVGDRERLARVGGRVRGGRDR